MGPEVVVGVVDGLASTMLGLLLGLIAFTVLLLGINSLLLSYLRPPFSFVSLFQGIPAIQFLGVYLAIWAWFGSNPSPWWVYAMAFGGGAIATWSIVRLIRRGKSIGTAI
jgi:hypothetical protein